MRSATDLLEELDAVDESTRIEAKRASEPGKSVMQSVMAFANEPGLDGGDLLLGVNWPINDKGDTAGQELFGKRRTSWQQMSPLVETLDRLVTENSEHV